MKEFIFKTSTTMKEYNRKKWWIDSDIITEKRIKADTLKDALEKYRTRVEDEHYITISNNALKYKNNMYVDGVDGETKQVGYVITGKTEIQDDSYKWVNQYIDLWVTILTVIETNFMEA